MTRETALARTDDERSRPNDIVPILIRRRWYFLAPLFILGLIGYALANVLPLQYKSSAFIIVEQRSVPDKLVEPNVLMTLQKRLDSMTQQILSRTRLQRLIEESSLYASERKYRSMDDIIDMMRKRVAIEPVQPTGRKDDVTGFHVAFSDTNPYIAQRVTSELASLFIEQDASERTAQSQQTTAFLESQLDDARKKLDAAEQQLSDFKMKHLGELPSQQGANVSILTSLEAQLQANTAALDRAEQQRIYLESLQSQQMALRNMVAVAPASPPGAAPDQAGSAPVPSQTTSLALAQATLDDLWRQLHDLSTKFTDKHPDVIRVRKEITEWQAAVNQLKAQPNSNAELASRLKATLAEIETDRRQAVDLRQRIQEVQAHLSQIPVTEQQMAEIERQDENAKAQVDSLLKKKDGSQLATNLEEQQGGEQFRLLDPASLPKHPDARPKVVMAGWALACAIGLGLTFLRELLDKSMHKQGDLEDYPGIAIMARIPTLRQPREDRRRAFRTKIEIAAVTCMVLVSLATGVQTLLQR